MKSISHDPEAKPDEAWIKTSGLAQRIFSDLGVQVTWRVVERDDDENHQLPLNKRPKVLALPEALGRDPAYLRPVSSRWQQQLSKVGGVG